MTDDIKIDPDGGISFTDSVDDLALKISNLLEDKSIETTFSNATLISKYDDNSEFRQYYYWSLVKYIPASLRCPYSPGKLDAQKPAPCCDCGAASIGIQPRMAGHASYCSVAK